MTNDERNMSIELIRIIDHDDSLPKITIPKLMAMNRDSVNGIAYALKHNVRSQSDFGDLTIDVIELLLECIEQCMTDTDTLSDILYARTPSDFTNSMFWHNCPCCGKLVDDGTADGRCFGCLNAAAKHDTEKQSKHTPK